MRKRVCDDRINGWLQCPAGEPVCRDRLRVDTTRVFLWEGSIPPWGAAGERSEFSIKLPLGAPLLIFPRGYLLKSFPQVDTSARRRGFEIRVFPLLGDLPKAIEPHLPVMPLATRFPRGRPQTRHVWICLQLSGSRGMDNGGVRAIWDIL